MAAQISKSYSSYKSQPKAFKFFLNFLPNGPHKTTFGIFEILKTEIVIYASYKSQPKVFTLLLNFLANGLYKTTFWIFEIVKIEILMIFFFVFLRMGPYGSQNFKVQLLLQIGAESFQTSKRYFKRYFKTLLLLQIAGESFETFSEFSSQWSSQQYGCDF